MSEIFARCLALVLDASLKVALLAAVAAVLLRLLQVRDSNVRHRVWSGVLVGMLILPALSLFVPALGLPFAFEPEWLLVAQDVESGSASLDSANGTNSPQETSPAERSEEMPSVASMEVDAFHDAIDVMDRQAESTRELRLGGENDAEFAAVQETAPLFGDIPQIDAEPDSVPNAGFAELAPAESPIGVAILSRGSSLRKWLPIYLASAWLVGGLVMGARLLGGLRLAFSLRRTSTPIDFQEPVFTGRSQLARRVAGGGPKGSPGERAHRRTNIDGPTRARRLQPTRLRIPIRQCPGIRVPLTVGAFHPEILLPPDWIDWTAEKLQAVLAHERTHVERADYAIMLLAELNRCVYWFHPLAWWLPRQLSDLAEEACDDAAIDSTGDRIRYARHLLEVAATLTPNGGRTAAAAVSMARRSNVETRINAILDMTRPLSRRLTWATTFVLVAMIVPFITLAAALRPAAGALDVRAAPLPEMSPNRNQEIGDETPESKSSGSESIAAVEPAVNAATTDGSDLESETEKNSAVALAESEPVKSGTSQPDRSATSADASSRTVVGRVVDEAGRPLANVEISVSPALHAPPEWNEERSLKVKGTTDAEGRFSIEIAEFASDEQETRMNLIATHAGYGIVWVELNAQVGNGPIELVLRPERPIKGRFIDTEGRAVAGAKISLRGVKIAQDKDAIDRLLNGASQNRRTNLVEIPTLMGPVTERFQSAGDDDGRFELKGIAADVICAVDVEATNHANAEFWIVNREGFAGRGDDRPANRRVPAYMPLLVGPDFTHVLLPDMKIEGRVTAEDDQGIRDVLVGAASGVGRVWSTRTDAEGRYRLGGVARRSGPLRMSVRPLDGSSFISRTLSFDVGPEDASKTVDVRLKRGIMLSGRVTDPLTGTGVSGVIRFSPLPENRFVDVPEFVGYRGDRVPHRVGADGNFRLSVIPGPGVILFQASGQRVKVGDRQFSPYCPARFDEEDSQWVQVGSRNGGTFRVKFGQEYLKLQNIVKYVDFAEDGGPQTLGLQPNRGKTVELEIVDAEGQPVSDAIIVGVNADSPRAAQLQESRAAIYGLDDSKSREVLVLQPDRGLVGGVTLEGDEASPLRIALGRAGKIRGRALDGDGKAIRDAKLTVTVDFREETGRELTRTRYFRAPAIKTGPDGRFEYPLVFPGKLFSLKITLDDKPLLKSFRKQLAAGEDVDLGDVDFQSREQDRQSATDAAPQSRREADGASTAVSSSQPARPGSKAKGDEKTRTFAGTVVDDAGQPVAGAKVSLSYFRPASAAENAVPQVLTDDRGRFEISWSNQEAPEPAVNRGWFDIGLTVTKEGFGFAYGPVQYFETSGRLYAELEGPGRARLEEASGPKSDILKLVRDDVPVRGRVVNVDGRPVAGAKVEPAAVWSGTDGSLDRWEANAKEQAKDPELAFGWRNLRQLIAGYVAPPGRMYYGGKLRFQDIQFKRGFRPIPVPVVATDAQGRFTLKGLGRERMAEFIVSGPGIETVQQRLRTRPGETLTRRPPNLPVSTVYPNEFTLVVAPSVPVIGRVTDLKTGHPIAGVRVHPASSLHTGALTNAEGRYRLEGLPLGSSELYLIPPTGSRYLAGGAVVKTEIESPVVVQEVTLAPGVRAQGRVIDEATKKPVSAKVRYFSYATNPHSQACESFRQTPIETEMYTTTDGHFEVPVLPGQGILGIEAGEDYPKGVGTEKIDCALQIESKRVMVFNTSPTWCNANSQSLLIPIDPPADLEELTVHPTLGPGALIQVALSAPDGEPIGKFFVHGERPRLPWAPHSWEQFSIRIYFPKDRRRLIVYHPDRNLAAHFELSGAAPAKLKIPLLRAATLVGRILDAEGEPVANGAIASRPLSFQSTAGKLAEEDRERGIVPMSGSGSPLSTDAEGRFEIKGIIPGVKYTAAVTPRERDRVGNRLMRRDSLMIFTDITAEAGETKQLGDIRIGAK